MTDLLGDDPIGNYDRLNDAATAAVTRPNLDLTSTVHFTYGDFPLHEGIVHLSIFRAFQAWSIAQLVGHQFSMPTDRIDGLTSTVVPHLDEWRAMGVFPPAITPPAVADAETILLCQVGYLRPRGAAEPPSSEEK